ncbi:MAG: class I SAM-dependent methyltransferase [Candidatus Dadabacteria bacterium]|nr:MAG: class I SAM-dependent methyltransferase [Candidatus Dadabacteria bacterium]
MTDAPDTSRISFTAHYTGHVWRRHGLGDAALATWQGQVLFGALTPFNKLGNRLQPGLNLEAMLLQRHRIIDALLEQAITGGATQVVEIAAGLSPRGLRFTRRHPDLHYLEFDLPGMAARKERLLSRVSDRSPRHLVTSGNALAADGEQSIAGRIATLLDPTAPTVVITEGLINYFPVEQAQQIWGHIVAGLKRARWGVYLSDIAHTPGGFRGAWLIRLFRQVLETTTRGATHFHFDSTDETRQALLDAGFNEATIHSPEDWRDRLELPPSPPQPLVHVIEARVSQDG